jgi:homoisocitrate dehydrogenase
VIRSCDGAIFGATQSPSQKVEGYASPILALRKQLDLYANLRPVVSMPVPGSRPGIDLLIVRENTECLYVKQERLEDNGDTAVAQRVITRRASERIARKAFEMAEVRAAQRAGKKRLEIGDWRLTRKRAIGNLQSPIAQSPLASPSSTKPTSSA